MAEKKGDERDLVRKYLAYLAKGWVIPRLSREEIRELQRRYPDDLAKAPAILKQYLAQLDELERRAGLPVEERKELLRRDLAAADRRMRRLQRKLRPLVDFKKKRVWVRREWHHIEDEFDLKIIDALIRFAETSPGEFISLKDMGRFYHKELKVLGAHRQRSHTIH